MTDLEVAIVGTGAIGENLAVALNNAGYAVNCIISRKKPSAHKLAAKVAASHAIELGEGLPEGLGMVFICVPDDAVVGTADVLGSLAYDWSGVCIAHTSGALTSSALDRLALKGSDVLSFHPVQTFKKEKIAPWGGVYIGIEGGQQATELGAEIATALGSIPLRLSSDDKVLYHASAVFASNFLVTVVGMATDILGHIQMSRPDALELIRPLVLNTCENVLTSTPEEALTGPASRGDIQTIKKHAEALRHSMPEKYRVYLELTREAVRLKTKESPSFSEMSLRMQKEIDQLLTAEK